MSSPEEQQPPADRPWPDPEDVIVMSEEDQRIFDGIIQGNPNSGSGRVLNRSSRDPEHDAYLLLTRQELAREISLAAGNDGNQTLSMAELRAYLTSTGSNSPYEGYTRLFHNLAVDAKRLNNTDIEALLLRELDHALLISDVVLAEGVREGLLGELQSITLPFSSDTVVKER